MSDRISSFKAMIRPLRTVLLVLIGWLALVGCAPLIRIEQPISTNTIRLEAGKLIGQTFTASYRGFNGVAIYLKPDVQGDGQLVLHVQQAGNPGDGTEIAQASLPLMRVQKPGFYRLDFSAQQDSTNKDYYFWFGIEGTGSLITTGGPGEVYLNGALYLNHDPQDEQLTFRLSYDRTQVVLGVFSEGVRWAGILLIGLFLFVLPGWAILSYCLQDWHEQWWAVKAGLATGVSLAFYPLLLLWTDLVGLHLGWLYAWLPPMIGMAGLAWKFRRQKFRLNPIRIADQNRFADIAMAVLLGLLAFTRFWVARGLVTPLWGDSYQHTMITQLLVDNKGLFDNWLPYSPSQSFTYHFGFHSLSAALHWLSSLPVTESTIWTGQLINIFAILCLVPLAVRIGRSKWAGVSAVFIGGMLLTLPQVYINWGRYTQLAGQVILPVAAYLGWTVLKNTGTTDLLFQRRQIVLLGFVMGGLALTHYRVLVFGGFFFIAAYLIEVQSQTAFRQARQVLLAGLIAALLFLPWFVHVFSGTILNLFAAQISTPASQTGAAFQEVNTIGSIFNFMPPWLWLLLFLATGWGLWRREKGTAIIALWWLLNLLSANPQWLNLPGAGAIGSFTVMIACYIPAALLIGSSAGWMIESTIATGQVRSLRSGSGSKYLIPAMSFLLLFVTAVAGIWSVRDRLNDLDVFASTLFTRADQRAANWIRSQVPQDGVFLVNSFLAYSGTLAVGSDGGWWLPLKALRQTTLPPINYDTEAGPREDYTAWVNQVVVTLQQNGIDDQISLDKLQEHDVSYVYIGQRQGSVNSPGPLFTPEQLLGSNHFKPLYHQDRIWIFSFLGP